jgi:hypothetical protein
MMRIVRNAGVAALIAYSSVVGAMAQQSPDSVLPRSPGWMEAPVGHRQPRVEDLPRNVQQSKGKRTEEEKQIDRTLNSICRGC